MTQSPTSPPAVEIRDDTTRSLCAAAHVSPEFADGAIREFLTESTRAIPPSPGIDAVTVLREAVAARQRRLIRDWILLALLVMFLLASPGLVLLWALVGILLCVGRRVRRRESLTRIYTALLIPLAGLVGAYVLVQLWALTTDEPGMSMGEPELGELSLSLGALSIVLAVLALVVLLLDRLAVAMLLSRSFRPDQFTANPTQESWPGEQWIRTAGRARRRYSDHLKRVAQADVGGNLVAYRGYEPFVGAGGRLHPIAFAIQLDSEESVEHPNGSGPTGRFALRELYDHVSAEVMAMRSSRSLSPGGRLAWLTERDQVVVPVEDLLANYEDPATRVVLPDLRRPPRQAIPPEELAEVIEWPREWARYYRCYGVETWNRELAVSCYLHFGASDRQLYLEWIPCVLLPIDDDLRLHDSDTFVRPVRLVFETLADWVRLPGELLFRLGAMFRPIQPVKDMPGLVRPEKYGTAMSLRELAAGERVRNYFQDSDAERYTELLTTRMLRAIGEFLEQHDISVTEFMRQAANIINNFGDNYGVNNFGTMRGDNYFGPRNHKAGDPRGPANASGKKAGGPR